MSLDLDRDGACRVTGFAETILPALISEFAAYPVGQAGVRLSGVPGLQILLGAGSVMGGEVEARAGRPMQPVRAVLFDKRADRNWALGWHQDRTIAERARHDVPGYGPWSIKQGIWHVEPPFALIGAMMTVRMAQSRQAICLAEVGDVWFYRTPILHASDPSDGRATGRRVLQVDYCGQGLPAPLEWLGIG
ncbi:phytanoyl-CoA dioxygenase [Novosphingobium sp. BW1]|uniref:phytanoyl-CoA dioxygenase n=1 Tax=Novosphingobium sp. BW1 TaxID=2592621 RepID=UPI0011DE9EF1|nr:phytanoyl-CoA dioxygenase [Novosphingobium sp. BW1]TYC91274.1 phytanoyl-CoA dioxygenase [Novosphingobium sp. BW1]